MPDWQTTLKDRATQLIIKYKSGALVTQCINYQHWNVGYFLEYTPYNVHVRGDKGSTAHLWGGALSPLILPPCLSPILPARGGGGGGRSPGPRASLPCWAPISLAASQAPCWRVGLPIMITLTIVTSSLPPAHQAHHLVSHPGITLVRPVWNNQCNDRSGNIHSTGMKPILYLKLTRDRPEWYFLQKKLFQNWLLLSRKDITNHS